MSSGLAVDPGFPAMLLAQPVCQVALLHFGFLALTIGHQQFILENP